MGKLSRVSSGQSKPPDLKQSKPLQPRLEQTRTGKLRSGQATPWKHGKDNATCRSWCQSANLNKIHQARTALSTQWKTVFQFRNSGNGTSDQLMSGLCRWVKIMKEGNPGMKDGMVPLEPGGLMLKELYMMRPEYADIKKNMSRADKDKAAFDLYVQNNPILYCNHKGYAQWQGSESQ
eukprot:jgi/Psemu1/49687/gm1.49687_g